MSLDFKKVTYVDGETVIGAKNLNDIQGAILDLDDNKVEKEPGKGLSTNDYSDTDKSKVDTALQASALEDYRTAAAQDEIDAAQDTEIHDLKSAVDDVEYDVGILKSFHKNNLTWAQIKNIVQTGHAQDWFQIGDQIEVNWTKGSTRHSLPFDVVSFDPVIKEGSNNPVPGLWLQSHYAMDGVQFDASEAIYVTDVALPAGVYNFTIGTNWGTHCVAGKVYQFTTTQEVPAGGQIMVGRNNDWYTWGAPDQDPANWRVHTFASNAATAPLESNLTLTEGSEGTALGSIASNTKYSNSGVNNLQRSAYGYNRWSMSAMRQYLNSADAKGGWWNPKNPFDRAPQQLATLDGFMTGFDLDFLSVLGKVKVTTALNTVSDSDIGTSEDTYDTFFLASLEQEYIVPQAAGVEGAYWPYWKERLGLDSPQIWYGDGTNAHHIRYAYDARASAQYCRLRSAFRGYAYVAWFVYPSGLAYSFGTATYAHRGCPACVIC